MSLTLQAPVVTRISDEIVERLQVLIAGDDIAYQFKDVIRPTRLAQYAPEHGLIVLTRGEVARQPEVDCPGNPPAIGYKQTFLIRVHVAPSELDETPLETIEDVMEAAIHNAIRNDADWHTFGGIAIHADLGAQMTMTADGGYNGFAVPLDVTYRISEGDPYTARA